jgi:hypothetical protein
MSNDEWIATEFELNEMLFVPAGDGAVPLSNSRRTTPILTAKWGPQSRLRPARRRRGFRARYRVAGVGQIHRHSGSLTPQPQAMAWRAHRRWRFWDQWRARCSWRAQPPTPSPLAPL